MSDRRDTYTRIQKCGQCKQPFRFAEDMYVPYRYESWMWLKVPVCERCADELDITVVLARQEPIDS